MSLFLLVVKIMLTNNTGDAMAKSLLLRFTGNRFAARYRLPLRVIFF